MNKYIWNNLFIKQDFLDEMFVVNSTNGETFTLNESAKNIVDLLSNDSRSAEDILELLGGKKEYYEDLKAIEEFLDDLLKMEVIKIEN